MRLLWFCLAVISAPNGFANPTLSLSSTSLYRAAQERRFATEFALGGEYEAGHGSSLVLRAFDRRTGSLFYCGFDAYRNAPGHAWGFLTAWRRHPLEDGPAFFIQAQSGYRSKRERYEVIPDYRPFAGEGGSFLQMRTYSIQSVGTALGFGFTMKLGRSVATLSFAFGPDLVFTHSSFDDGSALDDVYVDRLLRFGDLEFGVAF
jgi:hypothetical protein